MAGYNRFPGPDSRFQMAVVDSREEAKDKSCNQKCFSPTHHGENVDFDHLMQSPMLQGASGFLQQIYGGTVDPGTPVIMMNGLGGSVIVGQSNTVRKSGEGGDGGNSPAMSKVNQLTSHELEVNIPPDVRQKEKDGVMIYEIIEKGISHKLDLLDGLPLHGALFDMAGFRLPDVKNVPTAKQTNDEMMNAQMLQGLMGQVMSLGQMFQGLAGNGGAGGGGGGYGTGSTGLGELSPGQIYIPPGANTGAGGANYSGGLGNNSISAIDAPKGTPMYEIMNELTPEMRAAVNSLSILIQGMEVNNGVAFFTGDVVHEETYLQNAQDLLKQVDSLDDLMYVLHRLQWDTSLFGREKLSNVVTEIETAWGVALQEVDYNGNIVVTYDLEDANAEIEFLDSMTSNTGSPALGYFGGTDPAYSINATGAGQGFGNQDTGGGGSGGGGNAQQFIGQAQGLLGQIEGLAQGMSENMFGEAAETMKDLWKRMTREQENDAKKMHQKLNQAGDVQKMSKIIEKTVKGGKVFETQNFDENGLESLGDSAGSGNFGVSFQ